jgi:hypothetical protein
MRWIKIRGDAYSVGMQLGELARPAFAHVLPRIARYAEVISVWRGTEYLRGLEAAGRAVFPDVMRELEGIAKGAQMDFDDVLAWNCRGDFPGGGDQTALAGCTDVMSYGAASVMGHNEDDQPELDGQCFMVDVRPESGPSFVSFYSPGLLPGHTFGWNEAGLVQTINHLRTHDQQVGVPRHFLTRAVLGCPSLDDALEIIQTTKRAGGFHHNLGACSPQPRLVSVEAPSSGVVETVVTHTHAHTNHLLRSELAQVPQTIATSSAERQERAGHLVRDGLQDMGAAATILSDSHNQDWPIRRRSLNGEDTGFTLAACTFELRAEMLRWRVFGDPAAPALFSGEQPPK